MAAAARQLRALCYLGRVLLFLSQFYILSGSESTEIPPYMMKCPSNGLCSRLPADCIDCATNYSCVYGKPVAFDCAVKPSVTCVDQEFRSQKNFIINMTCRFCWQLPETDYECSNSTSCMTVSCPRQRYTANCTVRDHIHCLGNRTFPKMLYCNWTGGYKWSTALALSHLGDETPIGSTYEARPLCRCVAASPLEALEQTASTWVSGAKAWASSSASEAWEYGH
ncbi:TM2 domain-containing protein 3 isoform X1 [Castor canadensis]|uniref:TM2 domain-containing protein 3 isoform X1 n=1 Tax=Castor canadensis TaxID=51338 RepID=A0A8B7VR69_CASCN|nr:TM2 domain-containing protein 3 isoform X1 [Castor canadensis]